MTGRDTPQIIAHRGNSSVAPENTLAAFASAIAAGAGSIEIDLACTADGEIIVIHDDTFERTTSGVGPVAEATTAYVQSLDAGQWYSPAYAGQQIPTFAQFAELLARENTVEALVEFKGRWSTSNLALALEVLTSSGMSERAILQSFHPHTLMKLHALAPHLRRGALTFEDPLPLIGPCVEAGIYTLNPHVGYVEENPGVVEEIHAAGLRTQVWTANEPRQWGSLAGLGVDGIITDRPDALAGWLSA